MFVQDILNYSFLASHLQAPSAKKEQKNGLKIE
jgi:hypothetical protein